MDQILTQLNSFDTKIKFSALENLQSRLSERNKLFSVNVIKISVI